MNTCIEEICTRIGGELYARSASTENGCTAFMVKPEGRDVLVAREESGFIGQEPVGDTQGWRVCELTHDNA